MTNPRILRTPEVKTKMDDGGHTNVQTDATGTDFASFVDQPCRQFTVVNDTGTALEFKQGAEAVYLPIPDGMTYTFYGIRNTADLAVRRKDVSATQVTVIGRWEA